MAAVAAKAGLSAQTKVNASANNAPFIATGVHVAAVVAAGTTLRVMVTVVAAEAGRSAQKRANAARKIAAKEFGRNSAAKKRRRPICRFCVRSHMALFP